MIDFLIKSGLSLLLLLAAYHLFLEREKMHRFKRFYLLFSLAFSFAVPFITIVTSREVKILTIERQVQPVILQNTTAMVSTVEPALYTEMIVYSLYALIVLLLGLRFISNIMRFRSVIQSNTVVRYKESRLVLLKENTLPYTFMNWIFVNESDYDNLRIEQELYEHELTHIKQRHTLDILCIEVIKIIFWFNPLLLLYKKAIQLNHEFLADEKVVKSYNDIPFYQQLLLSKATGVHTISLASNLNYSITKKRLLMMTKKTILPVILLKKLATFSIVTTIFFLFCTKTIAQEKPLTTPAKTRPFTSTDSDKKRDVYYAGVRFKVNDRIKNATINKLYEELTPEEKKTYAFYVPEAIVAKSPTDKEFTDFKNSKKYAVWINEKNVNNKELDKYTPEDFAFVTGSIVHKNARTKTHPQPFQYSLYTKEYFNVNFKDSYKKYGGSEIRLTINNPK